MLGNRPHRTRKAHRSDQRKEECNATQSLESHSGSFGRFALPVPSVYPSIRGLTDLSLFHLDFSTLNSRTLPCPALSQLLEGHIPIQNAEANATLYSLLNDPANFYEELQRYSCSVATVISYGKRAPTFRGVDKTGFSAKEFYRLDEDFLSASM